MFLGEASYRPRTGLVQASYRPRTGAFYRRLEKRRRLRRLRRLGRLFSPWRLKVSTALILTEPQGSYLWLRLKELSKTGTMSPKVPFVQEQSEKINIEKNAKKH